MEKELPAIPSAQCIEVSLKIELFEINLKFDIMRPFSSLAFVLFLQGVFKDPDEMEAEFLKDTTEAHCNDGSAPLYYKRLTHASSEWMIYLQGGGVCIDHDTCLARFQV